MDSPNLVLAKFYRYNNYGNSLFSWSMWSKQLIYFTQFVVVECLLQERLSYATSRCLAMQRKLDRKIFEDCPSAKIEISSYTVVPAGGNRVKGANTTELFLVWSYSTHQDPMLIAVLKLSETRLESKKRFRAIRMAPACYVNLNSDSCV